MFDDFDDDDYITEEQMKIIKAKCREELKKGTDPRYLIGCIYGLYEDYIISEKQESELYKLVDPEELYNEPSEYWWGIDGNNKLAKCIGY